MFLAVSDTATVLTVLIPSLCTVTLAVITLYGNRDAAKKVADVKTTLKASTEAVADEMAGIKEVTVKTLEKVNGHVSINLKALAAATRQLAELTKTPQHRQEADAAEKAVKDHESEVAKERQPAQ